jgi:hypothetical protein
VISEDALVALLYRADWTKLSLAARLHRERLDRPRPDQARADQAPGFPHVDVPWADPASGPALLLIAPGGRYRLETTGARGKRIIQGSDGELAWLLAEPAAGDPDLAEADREQPADEAGTSFRMFGRPEPPAWTLTCPAWLLNEFALTPGEPVTVAGRAAHLLVATLPPGRRRTRVGPVTFPDRIEAAVDASLGILLRCQQTAGGERVRLDEMREVRLDPPEAADPAQFAPPDGATVSEHGPMLSGPGWRIARAAAGLAGSGLGFAIRQVPHRPPPSPAAGEPAMPRDYQLASEGQPEPLTSGLLGLLSRAAHRLPGLTAELHRWDDPRLAVEKLRSAWDGTGLAALSVPGVGPVAGAVSGHLRITYRVARIRVAPGGRYRIDYGPGWPRRTPRAIACDGQRRWRLYRDHLYAGTAAPMPSDIADLLDPSWLLGWQLSGGTDAIAAGRRGYRIDVSGPAPVTGRPALILAPPAEAVADTELGILLRLTSYTSSGPAIVTELRGISLAEPETSAFHIDAPPGVRVSEDAGGLLDEVDAPEPVRMAVRAVTDIRRAAGAGVSAVTSFVDALRDQRRPPPPTA